MANLFAAANQAAGPKPLISFRAGKMFKEGGLVRPDKRKGLIQLMQTDDMLIHFQWKDRATGALEEDLVIFPDEATFGRVEKCTTGRVYMLDFKGAGRQLFYWVQEPSEDKDAENCLKIQRYLNNPPPFRGAPEPDLPGAPTPAAPATGVPTLAANHPLGQLDREQLMGLLAGMSGNNMGRGGAPPDLAALQSVLQGFASQAPVQPAAPPAAPPAPPVDLSHVVDAGEIVAQVQADPKAFVARLMEHLPPLPPGVTPEQHLLDNLRSSQLQQTVSLFGSALSDPQAFSEIMTSFHLQPAPQGPSFGPQAFLNAIQHAAPTPPPPPPAAGAAPPAEAPAKGPDSEDKMEE